MSDTTTDAPPLNPLQRLVAEVCECHHTRGKHIGSLGEGRCSICPCATFDGR